PFAGRSVERDSARPGCSTSWQRTCWLARAALETRNPPSICFGPQLPRAMRRRRTTWGWSWPEVWAGRPRSVRPKATSRKRRPRETKRRSATLRSSAPRDCPGWSSAWHSGRSSRPAREW
ncbi:podJ, partial [Symbiodinium sp. CCMP2456]